MQQGPYEFLGTRNDKDFIPSIGKIRVATVVSRIVYYYNVSYYRVNFFYPYPILNLIDAHSLSNIAFELLFNLSCSAVIYHFSAPVSLALLLTKARVIRTFRDKREDKLYVRERRLAIISKIQLVRGQDKCIQLIIAFLFFIQVYADFLQNFIANLVAVVFCVSVSFFALFAYAVLYRARGSFGSASHARKHPSTTLFYSVILFFIILSFQLGQMRAIKKLDEFICLDTEPKMAVAIVAETSRGYIISYDKIAGDAKRTYFELLPYENGLRMYAPYTPKRIFIPFINPRLVSIEWSPIELCDQSQSIGTP